MQSKSHRKRVVIVQRRLTGYRVPFFELLRTTLSSNDIALELAHGDPTSLEETKKDSGCLPWAVQLPTAYFFGGRLCWQPFSAVARDADLVVITHENKLLNNLSAQYCWRNTRVALWGHGANFQGERASWRERFKRSSSLQADWWFGYTELSRALILGNGFPADRITVVNNAIDTEALGRQYEAVLPEDLSAWRAQLGISGKRVGIFLGSLYSEKRIDFLLTAASQIRIRVPDFEFVVAGAGPERDKVDAFCAENAWARYVGPLNGERKAQALALAHVMLNPGLVGLGVLDSFVCKVPLVTTDCGLHSPEIEYLENGRNGLMTRDVMEEYVDAVVRLLDDEEYRKRLVAGCAVGGAHYTLENMVRNFADGVMGCLDAPIHRGAP